jgi:cation:H+ antiporter
MIMSIVYIVIGIVLILWGADKLTDGASALARRMKVSEIVIGLTIVAFGTSMPEFVVSFISALKNSPDLAIGNIVGSNIFNAFAIVGCAAVVAPMTISKNTVKKDIPFALLASVVLIAVSLNPTIHISQMVDSQWHILNGNISRIDGLILLFFMGLFLVYTFKIAKDGVEPENPEIKQMKKSKITFFIVAGLLTLIFGGEIFVEGASEIARSFGVSESVIGLTLVACGTSLPELATSIVAARKGSSAIAIGNVIGSNVFNILAILGITALIAPMKIIGITMIDMVAMLLGILFLWFFSYTKYKINRWEGVLLILMFVVYLVWIISQA